MMRILMVLDYVYSGESTNIILARKLASALEKQGIDVRFLCNADMNYTAVLPPNARIFCSYKDKVSYELIKRWREEGKGILKLMGMFLNCPLAFFNILSTVLFKKSLVEKVVCKQIETSCVQEKVDAVITVSCPHYTMFALGASRIQAKKICYMFDPYHSNKTLQYGVSLTRERRLYKKIDKALITDLMYNENMQTDLKKFQEKMVVVPFPGILPTEKKNLGKTGDIILCAYVGALYPGIRSPEYLLQLLGKLDRRICFSFTGGGREGFRKGFFEAYKMQHGERLALNGPVDVITAEAIQQQADILINIGNSIDNQLPSKIFSYLSMGKPILNIYKNKYCPTLPYLKKYPLALNVQEGDFSRDTIAKIEHFCFTAKEKTMDFAEVQQLYKENTPQNVAEKVMDVLWDLWKSA